MDEMVLATQKWLNTTYGDVSGFQKVAEDGLTGWSTVHALTRALQHELGITNLSDNFGPETTSRFQPLVPSNYQTKSNMIYILQGALWCKGMPPGSWTGIFDDDTVQTVKTFQSDAGLTQLDGIVTTPMMKALLNMSAFVLVSGGDSKIREMQKNLNRDYSDYIGELQPCDGIYQRNTNKAIIYALQKEEGLSKETANGNFGPSTTSLCPTLTVGDSRTNFVLILQYALYCNGTQFDPGPFDGSYGSGVESAVKDFQQFMALPATGVADMTTIKGLLTSAGDTSRDALACDCATVLDANTAETIRSAGFKYVGRYLTGNANGKSKAMTREELQAIFNAGLRVFPIYEDGGYVLQYFTANQGKSDAINAIQAAKHLGLPYGTIIYFAVDCDPLDVDITNNIIPYFGSVHSGFRNSDYKIGVYGDRNVCSRVYEKGYAEKSFVAGMSTGWSGNLGFTMPQNWAFDQFTTITVGDSNLEVDKDAYSGQDPGIDHNNDFPTPPTKNRFNVSCTKPVNVGGKQNKLELKRCTGDAYEIDVEKAISFDQDQIYFYQDGDVVEIKKWEDVGFDSSIGKDFVKLRDKFLGDYLVFGVPKFSNKINISFKDNLCFSLNTDLKMTAFTGMEMPAKGFYDFIELEGSETIGYCINIKELAYEVLYILVLLLIAMLIALLLETGVGEAAALAIAIIKALLRRLIAAL